ncbi:MAG TPA: helix-turn-helix domain-containing protein [Solirubrobacteraceae bacterium]|nr:helix-turn-helix domain-containing protein [Solirubrobacteraceae bacterium]
MIIPLKDSGAGGDAPAPAEPAWTGLTPAEKDARLLAVAGEVFVRRGLDAPMSDVACAAGIGVASIYRRFESKQELLAALVVSRLETIAAAAETARAQPGDRFQALVAMVHSIVETQSADDFMGEARMLVADHPHVVAALRRTTAEMEQVLADARDEGRLRSDATTLDLRLLFAATRVAKRVEPDHWPRMLELMMDALEAPGPRP